MTVGSKSKKTAEEKYLVIVESPTKAKTLKKFLPKNFEVDASMGHVRDLPQSASDIPAKYKKEEWAKLGVNVEEDFAPLYVTPKGKSKILTELRKKLKNCTKLYLATDEDREGESISWHLLEQLKPKVPTKRMVFHEITKSAILESLEQTRDIDERLVQAQETRRILDRLYGYTLSPLLWKKIAYGLSAGRVQSIGLRLLVERERERRRFRKATYWDLKASVEHDEGNPFDAKMISWEGKRLATGKDFDELTGKPTNPEKVLVMGEDQARSVREKLLKEKWIVEKVEEKDSTARPSPPFITSTLQQEANRKLGLSARQAMRIAQGLYERGLITYMRTDSPHLSNQAINAARDFVKRLYGDEYLSEQPRQFTSKAKGAQEAHEAIRPAGDSFTHPDESELAGKELALYDLIWKRTVASQMADAKKRSMTITINAGDGVFTATGTRIIFPGFIRAYVEGSDDPDAALGDKEFILPPLEAKDSLNILDLTPLSHETKPPARYTEASIVRRLEQDGIGRPSTYASIIGTILERKYAFKQGNALVPTFTGFAVVQVLERHFEYLIDYGFTSKMEEALDEIAEGEREWLPYLKEFYSGKDGLQSRVQQKEKKIDPEACRQIELEGIKNIEIRVGRFGPYITQEGGDKDDVLRASIPEGVAPADLSDDIIQEVLHASAKGPQSIGKHPETGEDIYCLLGRFGPYVQLGLATKEEPKPKRASVPKDIEYANITLEQSVHLLRLPRTLGKHPESGKPIVANVGRFGPYVMHDGDFRSLKDEDVYEVSLDRALQILAEPKKKGRRGRSKKGSEETETPAATAEKKK